MLKRTVLYPEHKAENAKMVEFSGWEMPVSYRGILEEHQSVRQYAGVFDVSHMGVIDFAGDQTLDFLQYLTVNDVSALTVNQSQYTMMLDESGNILDDMILTRLQNVYRLVVNCGNTQKILNWLESQKQGYSANFALREELNILALQGPSSKRILESLMDTNLAVRPFGISFGQLLGEPVMISHTGYTGENGYELFVRRDKVAFVWKAFLRAGAAPIGLGARDTLRIEAGLPLYGQEIVDGITPFDLGYGWIVKYGKSDFAGRSVLEKAPRKRRLFGLTLREKVIARHGTPVPGFGTVTSGTFSPTLGKSIAMFMADHSPEESSQIAVEIRGKQYVADVTKLPFITRKY